MVIDGHAEIAFGIFLTNHILIKMGLYLYGLWQYAPVYLAHRRTGGMFLKLFHYLIGLTRAILADKTVKAANKQTHLT